MAPPQAVYVSSSTGSIDGVVRAGDEFVMEPEDDGETLPSFSYVQLKDATGSDNVIIVHFQSTCQGGSIAVGDTFGSLKVTALSTTRIEDAHSCSVHTTSDSSDATVSLCPR